MDDLHGRVVDCSKDGFLKAMDISCHSFIRMANLSEELMPNGGTLLTLSYFGSEKVVKNYNIMGPVKAALESTMRYMAAELGPKHIRVHAISPGPIVTRAAMGITDFSDLTHDAIEKAPLHTLTNIDDVGAMAAHLVSDKASTITGNVMFLDGGYHIMG
jgi:enoyl-[acyl-carrier protein] reductase I